MEVKLPRFSDNGESSLGLMFINNKFRSFSIEDGFREIKVMHKTRIPAGRYQIKLRTEGRFHEKYKERFKGIHVGMLELQDVTNYKYILIHPGNDSDDTSGCIIPGDIAKNNVAEIGKVEQSTQAYLRIYEEIVSALETEEVFISVFDEAIFEYMDAGIL